jgi:hypothetical protein
MSFYGWLQAQFLSSSSRKSSARDQRDAGRRDRSPRMEQLEDRFALACAAAPCWLQVTLTTTDMSGAPITSVPVGSDFQLQATVSDVRVYPDGFESFYPSTAPTGTFASYDDVTFDPSHVAVDGAIAYGPLFTNVRTPDADVFATPGQLDEIGAVADFSTFFTGMPSPTLLFDVPFQANAAGDVIFALDPADILPFHNSLLFGLNTAVPVDKIDFVNVTIHVSAPSTQDQILALTEQVNALVSSGVLNDGNGNALISKLDNALNSFNNSNNTAGLNKMEAFIRQVNAFLNSGKLTSAEAQSLIDAADDLIASVSA